MAVFTSAPIFAGSPQGSIRYGAQPARASFNAPTYAAAPTFMAAPTYAAPYARIAQSPVAALAACPMKQLGGGDAAPWGGGCPWKYDKTAFKEFCAAAINDPSSMARKELYGFLAECFLDADSSKDGLVGVDEFDFLIENAATLPRRFGLAPSWTECYGDVEHRRAARAEMFTQMDKHQRGQIGMEEWVEFTFAHITEKVQSMQKESLDFCHLEKTSPEQFIEFLGKALADKHSEEFKSLYEFLFKTFIESDVEVRGAITREQFDILIEDAAQAPRAVGLAPSTAQTYPTEEAKVAARQAEWDAMDTDKTGTISFDEFLNWAIDHIARKLQDASDGVRFSAEPEQPAQPESFTVQVQYSQPVPGWNSAAPVQFASAPVQMRAPVQYAAAPTYAAAPMFAAPPTYAAAPQVTYVQR